MNWEKQDFPANWPLARQIAEPHAPEFDKLKSESFDPAALWQRVNGDRQLLVELVELFMQECPRLLQKLRSSIEQGSFTDIQKFSHKLKGSALQFSGRGAASAAGALEDAAKGKSLQEAERLFAKLSEEITHLMPLLRSMVFRPSP